jgi:SET domain
VDLSVRSSCISTKGVFAERDFKRGQVIHQMGGRRLSYLRCVAEILTRHIRIDDPLQIGRNLYIALDDFSIRFNHSCEANAGIRRECELFALVDIPRGTEITFDYSMTVVPSHYSWFWKMSCNCGAPTCRKRIGDLSSVPPAKLRQYVEAGALQDYMLNYLRSSTK